MEGLETLFGGPYVTFKPAAGNPATEFVMATRPAPAGDAASGLVVELIAPTTMGLQPGSPVYFRKFEVGAINTLQMTDEGVKFTIFIEAAYRDKLKPTSRFWNASGVEVRASADGIAVNTEGLAALIAGGIAFGLEAESQEARAINQGEQFKLYANRESAEMAGETITLIDQRASGLKVGASIRYKGLRIGEVTHQMLNADDEVQMQAQIASQYSSLLKTNSIFWIAKPRLGLIKQENLAQLISGPEIRVLRGDGEKQTQFTLADDQPLVESLKSGLNIILETPRLGSLKVGTNIYFRQIAIGEVLGFRLAETADKVHVFVNIRSQYADLIRTDTRFWNASGISMTAGLFSGVDIKTESVEALFAGGIAVATPDEFGAKAESGRIFKLREDADEDWLEWRPAIPLPK